MRGNLERAGSGEGVCNFWYIAGVLGLHEQVLGFLRPPHLMASLSSKVGLHFIQPNLPGFFGIAHVCHIKLAP